MTALPAPLSELSHLTTAGRNAAAYFGPLIKSDDEVLRVGSWCVLLDRGEIEPNQFGDIVRLARYGAIRVRAFRFFQGCWEHDLAAQVAATPATSQTDADTRAMQAELDYDAQGAVEAHLLNYLATGSIEVLQKAIPLAEEAGGWRESLPIAIKLAILYPHDPGTASDLLEVIYSSGQADLLEAAIRQYESVGLHAPVLLLYSAALSMLRRDPAQSMQRLQQLSRVRADVLQRTMRRNLAMRLTAEGFEKLGDYRKAYAAYAELKKADPSNPVKLDQYYSVLRRGETLKVPPLPTDPRTNYFVMTGFARSGTTLLENALNSHPQIETFEETSAGTSMQYYIDRNLLQVKEGTDLTAMYLGARERYYSELDRRHRKMDASIFIDKMPMRSAEAKLVAKVFPDRRYIFSIRHPFDVVLSCLKQYFSRNMAMDHFRSFDSAVALYDYVMTQWFGTFSMEDPRVHYIRYDRLVTEFEDVMRGTLEFLGAGWDEGVLEFAKAADERRARTPSYAKVRQGLSIGVQTQWRNYGFLFQSPVAQPLHKWAKFFGYPVE
jgi:tetratricopeptide (TPR) repeat protein